MKLPVDYNKINWIEKRKIRNEYKKLQNNKCYYCWASLVEKPAKNVRDLPINKRLFPPSFFNYPVHLHHDHNTGMTIGAVHNYCNAVLWQYEGE